MVGIAEPLSKTLSEVLLLTQKDLPKELVSAVENLLCLLDPEIKLFSAKNDHEIEIDTEAGFKAIKEKYDYTGKIVIQKRLCTSVYSSEDSAKLSGQNMDLSSEEEEQDGGYFYYDDNGIAVPYDLDEEEYDLLEASLKNQLLLDSMPLGQLRSASTGSDSENYKSKLSSLFAEKQKDTHSGKENLEDLNNESPVYDPLTEFFPGYEPSYLKISDEMVKNFQEGKLPLIPTDAANKTKLKSELVLE